MTRREWLTGLAGLSPIAVAAGRSPITQGSAPDDVTTLSIAGLADAFATGRLTPLDVTAAYLARIDREDPQLGAFVTVTRERAVDDTRRVMTRWSAGARPGPLAGVPIAHKDLFATRGIRTTAGSRLHERWVPEEDAAVVARLADAGTVLLGKTNTHELGGGVTTINPFFGTTRNPHDRSRIAGGSSGGSAAAVAARLVVAATGSDTGGSVRIPAALCGCVGLKPTFALVDTGGLLGACPTFDHVGLLTRSVVDATQLLSALARPDSERGGSRGSTAPDDYVAAAGRDISGLRVGLPRPYFFDELTPGVAAAVDAAIDRLRLRGARVSDVTLPVNRALYDSMFDPIAVHEIRRTFAADWKSRPEAFSRDFAAVFAGSGPTAAAVARAREARTRFTQSVAALFADVDVLAMPTVPLEAPPIEGSIDGMRVLRNTWPFNAAGVPAISVPCGVGANDLPVGLQLVAGAQHEATLFAAAGAIERR